MRTAPIPAMVIRKLSPKMFPFLILRTACTAISPATTRNAAKRTTVPHIGFAV